MRQLPREPIRAVHDDDLEELLEGLGILGRFRAGRLSCKFCHDTVAFANLHSIFPQSGSIKVVCDRPDCLRQLYELLRGGVVSL